MKVYSSDELALTVDNCPKISKEILKYFANNCELEVLRIMKEQEWSDLTDLQLARQFLYGLKYMNCFEEPNKSRLEEIKKLLWLIITDNNNKLEIEND